MCYAPLFFEFSGAMRTFCVVNYYRRLYQNVNFRHYCSKIISKNEEGMEKIRNIGILAHIDAGKTTTTERMLYYSGTIRAMGEVHHGNTVTDYMEQERQRGITITSAAVSFPWNDHQINLIDTPGHIDFTMEVEQSLAVLDGVVIVMDGSAGVEAQTLTVWHQASDYRVPRILYLNKMDRADADEEACLRSIREKLRAQPLLLHTPVRLDGKLVGLIDIINKEQIIWTHGRGQKFARRKLTEANDGLKWELTLERHRQLIDTLSTLDDSLANTIIEAETIDNLNSDVINAAVRRCVIQMSAFPVLCGSSYKNVGVQALMDAVIHFLPSPLDCHKLYKCFDKELAARVFKIQHDDQRGVLSFLRLYSGSISKGHKLFNFRQDKSEMTGSLYVAYADEYKSVEAVTAGNIAVISNLKDTISGDLITSTQSAASRVKSVIANTITKDYLEELLLPSTRAKLDALETDPTNEEIADVLLGVGTTIPEPVFLCSIEPPSVSYQQPLEVALAELQREDPSLRVQFNDESGQIVLAGMGELHLEIIKERIIREYKINVELGPLYIAYRETMVNEAKQDLVVDRKIGNQKQYINIKMSAKPVKGIPQDKILRLDKTQDSASNLSRIHPRQMAAVISGVQAALSRGPKLSCPVIDVRVTLHWLEIGRGTSDSILTATVAQCLKKILEQSDSILLEPVMRVEVVCPESHVSRVMADLTRRRTDILQMQVRNMNKVIECLTPLSELVGYATLLRTLSSGLASFTMEFHSHRQMAPQDEQQAITNITGF